MFTNLSKLVAFLSMLIMVSPSTDAEALRKRASCTSAASKRDTECILKVEIKTLQYTKLRLLYKSCYSACIKDNKTYSSLLFCLFFQTSDLFKFDIKMALRNSRLPYPKPSSELCLPLNIWGQGCKLVKCHKDARL